MTTGPSAGGLLAFDIVAKANPGKLNYASGGIGSAQHLTAELFSLTAGINMVHVPFKGAVSIPDMDEAPDPCGKKPTGYE